MPARKSTFQIWYEHVKKELLITEPQNISARATCCQNIINECVFNVNSNLDLAELTAAQKYVCNANPVNHLKFLMQWPGLRIDNSPKAPKTMKEYEKKSKNWLNGRRAPNYGRTLFPFFIADAERYVLSISKLLIANNEQEKRRLYYDIVIYKILAQLCGCSVSLHEQAKKAPFFCKNSIERKGRLKEMLQSYASDHEYIQGFPSCFEEAIGYFDRKSNRFFHEYKKQYLSYNKGSPNDNEDDRFSVRSLHSNSQYMIKAPKPHKPPQPMYSMEPPFMSKKESQYSIEHKTNAMDTTNSDAEYWKDQFIKLRRELSDERQMRMRVERERDNLKTLIHTSTMHAVNHNCNTLGALQSLPLHNDNSYDWNGSSATVSTASSNSYSSHCTPSNVCATLSHPQSNTNGFRINRQSTQSVNPYSSGISFVDNCTNSNVYSINANDFAITHQPHNGTIHSNALYPPSLTDVHSTTNDALCSNIMENMPIMNAQQRSNDSFAQYQTNNNTFLKSAAPLYSFQNAVADNETFGL